MSGVEVPTPITRSDEYLAQMCRHLHACAELLEQIFDRLPPPPQAGEPVELREPAPAAVTPTAIREPKPPAKRALNTPAKKTPARPAVKKGAADGR